MSFSSLELYPRTIVLYFDGVSDLQFFLTCGGTLLCGWENFYCLVFYVCFSNFRPRPIFLKLGVGFSSILILISDLSLTVFFDVTRNPWKLERNDTRSAKSNAQMTRVLRNIWVIDKHSAKQKCYMTRAMRRYSSIRNMFRKNTWANSMQLHKTDGRMIRSSTKHMAKSHAI